MATFTSFLLLTILFAHTLADSTPPISSSITMVGSVYCDTCFHKSFSKHSFFMPGADVHVECKMKDNSPKTAEMIWFSANRTTDKNGVYKVEIASMDGVDCVEGDPIQSMCQATLIGSSLSECNVPGLKPTTHEISVKSKHHNLCVYSFTPLSFRPHKRNSSFCGVQAEESAASESYDLSLSQNLGLPPLTFPSSTPPSLPFPFPRFPTTWRPLFPSSPPANPPKHNP